MSAVTKLMQLVGVSLFQRDTHISVDTSCVVRFKLLSPFGCTGEDSMPLCVQDKGVRANAETTRLDRSGELFSHHQFALNSLSMGCQFCYTVSACLKVASTDLSVFLCFAYM